MIDDYSDLPEWIRPGAKLAIDTGTLVVVTKITPAQIVATMEGLDRIVYRFDRKPLPANPPRYPDPRFALRGRYGDYLVRRTHPTVIQYQVDQIAKDAVDEVVNARRVYGNPREHGDKRPTGERAMDLLDAIENAARTARRAIEQLTDPGGMLAAEYAQDLTTTPEG